MDALDTSIINTAIPAMAHSLKVNPVDLKIALISYLVSLAIFIPISGWVADKFGIKRIFVMALGIFTLSSFWCGSANSLTTLVIARSLQGIGGSFMLPLGRLIIVRTFPRHEIVNAMNAVIMVVSLGLMLGPFAGGVITYHLSWHWIFWINIPVGALAIGLALYWLQEYSVEAVQPLDLLGFILFGGGLAILTFALSYLSESYVKSQTAVILFCAALSLLAGYFLHSRGKRAPIINNQLFLVRTFQVSVIGNLFARLGFGSLPFLLPLLLQVGLGYSPQLSGILLTPVALGVLLVKYKEISTRLLRYFGYKRLLIINTLLVGLVLWLFEIVDGKTSIYLIALLTFVFGVLVSLQYSAINSLAYADIPKEDFSGAVSISSTVQQLAQSFGVAVAAVLLRLFSQSTNNSLLPVVFHRTFFTMGIITFLTAYIFIRLKPTDGYQLVNKPAS